jgi:hypothetical protein
LKHSLFWIIPFALIAGGFAWLLYYRDIKSTESPFRKYIKALTALRFLVVFGILTLLLNPFIKHTKTAQQKPIVAILADNSESIRNGFKQKEDSINYFKSLENLQSKLAEKYEVAMYSVGDKLEKNSPTSLTAQTSNLSSAITEINDLYYNQNLGAVILASDGIYNQGINPIYAAENAGYKMYTIAMGDTTIPRDAKIAQVYANKIAYLNDQFGIKVDISATNCSGSNLSVSLSEIINGNRKLIASKSTFANSDRFAQSIDFVTTAEKPGVAHYVVSVSSLTGEVSYANNSRDIYVEILDGRQKILLIAASPHPDIAALKSAIESNKNYQLDIQYADDFSAKIADYSLVIFHQLPSNTANIDAILAQVNTAKKSTWWITGSTTQLNNFNKVQSAVTILGNVNKYNDVSAAIQKDFNLFLLSDATTSAFAKFPPLDCFFGEYKSNPALKSLFTQKINNIVTDYPLFGFIEVGDLKSAVLCGEGLWRWKLYDFMQNKNNEAFYEIVNKTVQYLSVVNDKRPFKVNVAKNIFAENEPILFDAQLYNASFEMLNTPDVDLVVQNEQGKKFDFKFNKTEKYYTLNTGFLPTGNYQYSAKTKLDNSPFSQAGKFSVAALQLEDANTVADFELMRQLAISHQGLCVSLQNAEKITNDLLSSNTLKSILYDQITTDSGINLWWILALVALWLLGEWFIRKWSGGY